MKATELRIGNYVHIDYPLGEDGKLIKISPFHLTEMLQCEIAETKHNYIPIPLTEEWLLKFGFEKEESKPSTKHHNYFSKYISDYKYCFTYAEFREDFGVYIEYTDSSDPNDDGIKYPFCFGIKYVHQLQNLFYSLTGTELSLAKNKTETNNANETKS
jgi:hypothetical protein